METVDYDDPAGQIVQFIGMGSLAVCTSVQG